MFKIHVIYRAGLVFCAASGIVLTLFKPDYRYQKYIPFTNNATASE